MRGGVGEEEAIAWNGDLIQASFSEFLSDKEGVLVIGIGARDVRTVGKCKEGLGQGSVAGDVEEAFGNRLRGGGNGQA